MKLFIDTNIFLDFLLEREESYFAKKLLIKENNYVFLTSDKCILDIVYIWKKYKNKDIILEFIKWINKLFHIWWWKNINFENIIKNNDFNDFEDSFQYEIAKKLKADFIITNNKKDFKNSKITTITAKEFLEFNF